MKMFFAVDLIQSVADMIETVDELGEELNPTLRPSEKNEFESHSEALERQYRTSWAPAEPASRKDGELRGRIMRLKAEIAYFIAFAVKMGRMDVAESLNKLAAGLEAAASVQDLPGNIAAFAPEAGLRDMPRPCSYQPGLRLAA